MIFKEASWKMDGRVDVMPPSKFHYNITQQQETDGKGIFL
jgi:hypothetical protein